MARANLSPQADKNASIADQTINAATTASLTGSRLDVSLDKMRIQSILRWWMHLSKTAAGTAANSFIVRCGANGDNTDPAILTFALPVGTAIADDGQIDITVTIRGPLSAACIAQGSLRLVHNLSATGLATVPAVVLKATSAAFNATTAGLKWSVSCTTAASTVLTFQQVIARAENM